MNNSGIRVEGLDNLNRLLRAMPDEVKGKVKTTLRRDLMDLQGKSAERAPYELGALEGSAKSDVSETMWGVEGYVGFFEPYATIQHENLDFQHEPGRTAKYLERPLKENLADYIRDIEQAIRDAVDHI